MSVCRQCRKEFKKTHASHTFCSHRCSGMAQRKENDGSSKRCPRCKGMKIFAEFSKRTKAPDGRQVYCKACTAKYYADHRKQIIRRVAKYAVTYQPQYRSKNREKVRASGKINDHRRRTRVRALPVAFTSQDWQHALSYFHSICAYCGNGPSMFDVNWSLHLEHYIPLTSQCCPGTIPTNVVPACQWCNLSKSNHDALEWLTERYGKRKAQQINARIQTYFASLKDG